MRTRKKKRSDTTTDGFNFKQMIEDKKQILTRAEEKRKRIRATVDKKPVE